VIPEGRGKSRTSGKKSWVERDVGVLTKRSAEGTKRGVVAFRRKKKEETDIGRRISRGNADYIPYSLVKMLCS
jgi:hypothetical protein